LDLQDGTVNANNHAISAASNVFLGVNNGPFVLNNRGAITTGILAVSSAFTPSATNFNLTAADHVTTFDLVGVSTTFPSGAVVQALNLTAIGSGATAVPSRATTSATGNITGLVNIDPGSTLTLGADLSLNNQLAVQGTLVAGGHAVGAPTIIVGSSTPGTLQNPGGVTAVTYQEQGGSQVQWRTVGSAISGTLDLQGNSELTLGDAVGQVTGATLNGAQSSELMILDNSILNVEVNGLASGWVFRWANPTAATDHIADLQALISQGRITFTDLNGGNYALTSDPTFTYIVPTAVPEPSTLLLTAGAAAGLVWRRRRGRSAKPLAA
jgi:hypothetical protein